MLSKETREAARPERPFTAGVPCSGISFGESTSTRVGVDVLVTDARQEGHEDDSPEISLVHEGHLIIAGRVYHPQVARSERSNRDPRPQSRRAQIVSDRLASARKAVIAGTVHCERERFSQAVRRAKSDALRGVRVW